MVETKKVSATVGDLIKYVKQMPPLSKNSVKDDAKDFVWKRLFSHILNVDKNERNGLIKLALKNTVPTITIPKRFGGVSILNKIVALSNFGIKSSDKILKKICSNPSEGEGLREPVRQILSCIEIQKSIHKIEKILSEGVKIFSRHDEDGVERDYFGFPVDMDVDTRRKHVIGSWKTDKYTQLILKRLKIDQTLRQRKKIQKEEACRAIYKAYWDHRTRHRKEKDLGCKNLIGLIQDDIKSGKLSNPSSRGKILKPDTLRRIVYNPSFK